VTVKVGRSTRRGKLSRTCTYRVTLPKRRGKVTARFGGNALMAPRSVTRS
jgi:hypothetical protein